MRSDELMTPKRQIRGHRWGGCLVGGGQPAIYVVVRDDDGEDTLFFCHAELKAIEETAQELKRAMS